MTDQLFYDDPDGRHYIDSRLRYTPNTPRPRRVSRPIPRPLTTDEEIERDIRREEDSK